MQNILPYILLHFVEIVDLETSITSTNQIIAVRLAKSLVDSASKIERPYKSYLRGKKKKNVAHPHMYH